MKLNDIVRKIAKTLNILLLLYLFLVSIALLSASFKTFGSDFANRLIQTTSNPFVGLFIGILTTSIIQSSSTTTSMIVGFVASGMLTIENAIPMVMGANIGTTVTNTLVSLGHITRKEEFKRAMSCSSVHDLFNVFTVLVLFPLELTTGYLRRTAGILANIFGQCGGIKVMNPIKAVIKPAVHLVKHLLEDVSGLSTAATGVLMLILALILLFTTLFFIVKIMKSSTAKRAEIIFGKILGRSGLIAIFAGLIFTAIVQSSSITTSILVPIVASGITTVEAVLPITMGANLGTTVTAMLAALTGNMAGITIAFAHLLFNATGVILVYNIAVLRRCIILASKKVAALCAERRILAFVYVGIIFYVLPTLFIFMSKFFGK
ncbi:MAG: Na/Pi symporter [Candidatus Omnitrophica bacterium]|nr:Na/Pi symporter [Candidatus Omnitrophota bacterium]